MGSQGPDPDIAEKRRYTMAADAQATLNQKATEAQTTISQQAADVASTVEDKAKEFEAENPQVSQAAGKLMLASIGAVGLATDAFEGLFHRAIERGEASRKQARMRMKEMSAKRPNLSRRGMNKFSETVRDTADLPSKSDIQSLHDQIADLSAKVDKLNQEKKAVPKPPITGQ